MKTNFYDIESMDNVFSLCNWRPDINQVDVYLMADDPALYTAPGFLDRLLQVMKDSNPNFDGTLGFFDLHETAAGEHLALTFGLSDSKLVNDPNAASSFPDKFRPVCDTDPSYDENVHPYLMGYNSYNYDTTMLAQYLCMSFPIDGFSPDNRPYQPEDAKAMYAFSSELFSDRFKKDMSSRLRYVYKGRRLDGPSWDALAWRIRKSMLMSGRHIDVARLNEKQQHVGLKRIIGMLGGQILESKKIQTGQTHINDEAELLELLAYNLSDCINLDKVVFQNKAYMGPFQLKKGLLKTYPELIYDRLMSPKGGLLYKPDIRPAKVRRDRLFIDSSSAQLATKSLCPYGHLTDIPVVSFLYPSEKKSKELGVPRVNILEQTRRYFYEWFPQPELRQEFDRIYAYYKNIEGKNFNESKNYFEDYGQRDDYVSPSDIREYSKADTCIPYYDVDGKPTSGYAAFSIGGIHGAEYNLALYQADVEAYEQQRWLMEQAKAIYPDPIALRKAKTVEITMPDGELRTYTYKTFLKGSKTIPNSEYKDMDDACPVLFKVDAKGAKLNDRYAFTSAGPTNHEDFTSYYPNLLRMMSAFWNDGLGYDRYAEIFDNKTRYGFIMKGKNANLTPEQAETYRDLRELTGLTLDPLVISDAERAIYDVQRNGTKLILNSASGAADANFESNIRMHNQIISMRIIGQLFSYTIAQAQAFAGARITSTNTDGLFTILDKRVNNPILEAMSANIGVEIEPEDTYLISKDTNNRIELDAATRKVERASGGTVGCQGGPDPQKSLAHPAIIDWALTQYLIAVSLHDKGLSLSDDFDEDLGREIIDRAKTEFDPRKQLVMFQNIIANSTATLRFNFYTTDAEPDTPVALQHYNRVFIMKDQTPNTVHLSVSAARKLTPAMIKKRTAASERLQQHDPVALRILDVNGVPIGDIPSESEAIVTKVTKIETEWYMLVCNKDIKYLPDSEVDWILANLDYEKYLGLLRDSFTDSWKNTAPPGRQDMNMELRTPVLEDVIDSGLFHHYGIDAEKLKGDLNTMPENNPLLRTPKTAAAPAAAPASAPAPAAGNPLLRKPVAAPAQTAAPVQQPEPAPTPEPVPSPAPVEQPAQPTAKPAAGDLPSPWAGKTVEQAAQPTAEYTPDPGPAYDQPAELDKTAITAMASDLLTQAKACADLAQKLLTAING